MPDGRGGFGRAHRAQTHTRGFLPASLEPKFCWRAAGNPAHAEPPAPDVCLQRAGSCVSRAPSTSCLLPELAFPPNIYLRAWGNAWSLPPPQKHACSPPSPSHGGFVGLGAGCSSPSVTARSAGRQGSLVLGEFPQIFGCWGVGSRAAQSQGCEQLLALCKSRRRAGGSQKLWDLLLGEPRELRGHALLSKATERVRLGAKIRGGAGPAASGHVLGSVLAGIALPQTLVGRAQRGEGRAAEHGRKSALWLVELYFPVRDGIWETGEVWVSGPKQLEPSAGPTAFRQGHWEHWEH